MHFAPELRISQDFAKLSAQGFFIGEGNQGYAGLLDDRAFGRTSVTDDREAAGESVDSAAAAKVKAAADPEQQVGFAEDPRYFRAFAYSEVTDFDCRSLESALNFFACFH